MTRRPASFVDECGYPVNSDVGVTIYDGLDRLSPGCVRLMAGGGRQSLYHSLAWYQNLVEHALDPGDALRLYALEAQGQAQEALAILPLRLTHSGLGRWQARGLTSLSNYYSSLWGPILAESGHDPCASLRRLIATVCAAGARWDFVRLGPLSTEAPLFPQFIAAFREGGMVVQPHFWFGNWYLEVAGRTSDQYFGGLPSALRNTISRKSKKLEASKQARIQIVTGGSELEQAIEDYGRIYSASWKTPEPYPRFVPGLIRTCAQMGWLRLGLLYMAEQPVAAQLWIVAGNTASIYKLAYDEKYAALSPGSVLTARLMRHVIDVDKVEVVDYLTGDDAYKKDWMSHRRERWGILAFNPKTVRGLVGIARHVGGRFLRNLLVRSRARFSGDHPPPIDGIARWQSPRLDQPRRRWPLTPISTA